MENQKVKKPFYKKWWFWVILVVIVLAIVGGALGSSGGEEGTGSAPVSSAEADGTASEESTPASEAEPAPIEISATDLITAYDENEIAADEEYQDKLLQITGTVKSIGTDVADRAYLMLADDRNEYAILGVQCYFEEEQAAALADLKEGDTVTLTGTCEGVVVSVSVKDCTLVS